MTQKFTSLLLISPDEELSTAVKRTIDDESIQVSEKIGTVVGLNGSAISAAASHDIVLFDADPSRPNELEAIRALSDARAPNSIMIALTKDDIPLSKAREFNRAGVDDVLLRSSIDEELGEQIQNWKDRQTAQLPAIWAGQSTEGKIVAVVQSRGGIGASTIAVNLADALQNRKGVFRKTPTAKVIVVDLDFQFGTIASLLDIEESDAMFRMAMDCTVPDLAFVEQCIVESDTGLFALTAPTRFGPLDSLKPDQISRILDLLRQKFDYIVVDLPRALVNWIEPVLAKSDRLLLATDVSVPSIRSSKKLIDFFLAENPNLDIEVVVNKEKKPLILASHHREAQKLLERDFGHWLPHDSHAAKELSDRGKPLSQVAPRSPLARSVRILAQDLMKVHPPRQTQSN
jgi:pilus assembly protein CpaE